MLAAGAVGWWYWTKSGGTPPVRSASGQGATAPAQPARIPVGVASVETSNVPIWLNGLGTVQAFNTVLIRSRVDGALVEVAFQEGQMIREGEILARIDPRPYQAALDSALAKKQQDEATLVSTRQDLARTQALANQSFAPRQQLDQQSASVQSQIALIAVDQAAIDNARTQLDYTTIRAPLSGRLGLRLVDKGNIVRASDQTGIVEIAQLQPIAVILTAPETQLGAVMAAQGAGSVRIVALTSDNKTVLGEGELALVNNSVDAASGTVRIKAVFPNAESKLWPGLSVNTRLLLRTMKDVLTVPEDAIQRGERELFVFAVGQDGKAEKKTVAVTAFSEGRAVVQEGLAAVDRVVISGQSRVQPGATLEVAEGPGAKGRDAHASADDPNRRAP